MILLIKYVPIWLYRVFKFENICPEIVGVYIKPILQGNLFTYECYTTIKKVKESYY